MRVCRRACEAICRELCVLRLFAVASGDGDSSKGGSEGGSEGSGEGGGGEGGGGEGGEDIGKRRGEASHAGDEGSGSGVNGTGTVRPPAAAAANVRSAGAHCRGIFVTIGPPALISLRPADEMRIRVRE